LFTIILVGLAGKNTSTQSATIRSLIFTLKQNVILSDAQMTAIRNEQQYDEDDDNVMEEDRNLKDEGFPDRYANMIVWTDPGF